jgi:Heterokaryon incompatibility protein Het-C
MASEGQGWDTSTAFIRRTFRACIEAGRRAGGREGADLWEAYRLLGTGMHTMEDLLAHSNWCEIALRKMGHQEVFCHVGDDGTVVLRIFHAASWFIDSFFSDYRYSKWASATTRHWIFRWQVLFRPFLSRACC